MYNVVTISSFHKALIIQDVIVGFFKMYLCKSKENIAQKFKLSKAGTIEENLKNMQEKLDIIIRQISQNTHDMSCQGDLRSDQKDLNMGADYHVLDLIPLSSETAYLAQTACCNLCWLAVKRV